MIKEIPGFAGYFADENGDIWTNRPKNGVGEPTKELRKRKKSKFSRKLNYMTVSVKNNGIATKLRVGYAVLITFVSPRPDGMLVCHGPKGSMIDSLDNLSWGTPSKNNREDKLRDGTLIRGERSKQSKLNNLQVRIIRRSYGFRNKLFLNGVDLGRYFGVTDTSILRVVSGETWSHV